MCYFVTIQITVLISQVSLNAPHCTQEKKQDTSLHRTVRGGHTLQRDMKNNNPFVSLILVNQMAVLAQAIGIS